MTVRSPNVQAGGWTVATLITPERAEMCRPVVTTGPYTTIDVGELLDWCRWVSDLDPWLPRADVVVGVAGVPIQILALEKCLERLGNPAVIGAQPARLVDDHITAFPQPALVLATADELLVLIGLQRRPRNFQWFEPADRATADTPVESDGWVTAWPRLHRQS